MESYRNDSATLNASWVVYGTHDGVSKDDPAEFFHEASSLYPTQLTRQLPGMVFLETSPQLQLTASRSTKRHPHLESIALPPSELPDTSLADVLASRRSAGALGTQPLDLRRIATLLRSSYGVTGRIALPQGGYQSFRTAPSAGALYPLDVYPVVFNASDLGAGVYHYDPLRDVLELLRRGDTREGLLEALPMRQLAEKCAVAFIVTATFWRCRFKYGQRGYRFALLEAGHLTQNLLLTSEALGLGAAPIGGFYDRKLAEYLEVDGVNESPVYVIPVGLKP
jgi:SagB-type dehydrogenase family enzyme